MLAPKLTVKLGVMYTRAFKPPARAFFLFGPRGTGKSTYLKQHFAGATWIDLLPPATALEYQKDPSLLRHQVLAQPRSSWTVVDEVQKAPQLLDEVHHLMENEGRRKFVLTGSSARKIKRGAANLLAGRAVLRRLFPLNSRELNYSILPAQILRYGTLPLSVTARSNAAREDYLQSYVSVYLSEEIKAESLVRNVGSFARFLEIAALSAGQQVNMLGLSRDSGIARDTVRGYFEVFEDTLIGSWLPAYRPRVKVKEIATPRFYWFDCGVLHAAAGGFRQPLPADWKGILLEHWVYHEIRSHMEYAGSRGTLGYWRTPSGSEIDFLWWYGPRFVGIEVKAASRFRPDFLKGIRSFEESKPFRSTWVVYLGDKELKVGATRVLPVMSFLKKLHSGEVLG